MAYVDRNAGNARVVVVTAVALLHGAAIYALISGLAVSYIKEITTVLQAENIPVDQPTPTPRPPQIDEKPIVDSKPIVTPIPQLPLPLPSAGPTIDTTPVVPIKPNVLEDASFQRVPPPEPFTPVQARPRGDKSQWATTSDYPARDLREGNQGTTGFTLTIGTDGRVAACTITRSSGFAGLDEATCRNVSRRARFEATTDGNGKRVAGTFSSSIRWVIPED